MVQDKLPLEFGMHGHRAYGPVFVLMEYNPEVGMSPVAITADEEFAEQFIIGKEEWPEDGVGVIRILALPMED
jgi:hypothetical protein